MSLYQRFLSRACVQNELNYNNNLMGREQKQSIMNDCGLELYIHTYECEKQ